MKKIICFLAICTLFAGCTSTHTNNNEITPAEQNSGIIESSQVNVYLDGDNLCYKFDDNTDCTVSFYGLVNGEWINYHKEVFRLTETDDTIVFQGGAVNGDTPLVELPGRITRYFSVGNIKHELPYIHHYKDGEAVRCSFHFFNDIDISIGQETVIGYIVVTPATDAVTDYSVNYYDHPELLKEGNYAINAVVLSCQ